MKVVGLQTHIWSNNLKSMFLLAIFPFLILVMVVLIAFEFVIAGDSADVVGDTLNSLICFTPLTFMGVALWFLIAWAFNKQMILSMTKAQPIDRQSNPKIYNIVENLCISRGLPVPKFYIIQDHSMNAFASGLSPKSSIMVFSKGLLERLNDKEIEAVAAHELTHIINRDIRLMVIAIIFVGIIQTMAEVFMRVRISSNNKDSGNAGLIILGVKVLAFVLGFFVSIIVQMAISRKREFMADAGAVELTKSSEYMISALEKISSDPVIEAIDNRSVAQIFTHNPVSAHKQSFITKIFSTHPPMEDRIAALRQIG